MKPLKLSPSTLEKVPVLKKQKNTFKEIGEILGISKGTAWRIYKGKYHQQVKKEAPVCNLCAEVHFDNELLCEKKNPGFKITSKPKPKRPSKPVVRYAWIVLQNWATVDESLFEVWSSEKRAIKRIAKLNEGYAGAKYGLGCAPIL